MSKTKSLYIIALLIGIAHDQGMIKRLDQPKLDFFPDYQVPPKETTLPNITLQDMLTMSVPYKYKFALYIKYFTSDDWVKFSLDPMGDEVRSVLSDYAPLIGPDVLSGILTQATGQSVLDFAKEHLFDPLGITVDHNIYYETKEEQMAFNQANDISGWAADAKGINTAGWGLTLSTREMISIGQLMLQEGTWEGISLISPEWIHACTTEHNRWRKQDLPYGYLWWIGKDNAYMAMGDGGNTLYINPDNHLVIAINAYFTPRAKDRISLIKEVIEPLFISE